MHEIDDDDVIRLINNEFALKTLGMTKQYLEIHQPVYENGHLKIDRIDRKKSDDLIIAYLPVKGEYFFFAVYIDVIKRAILGIGTESRNIVSLRATSEKFGANELQVFLKLKPSRKWGKGDSKSNGRGIFDFSCVEYTPNPEPDQFEDKLRALLLLLEREKEGILALGQRAYTYIQVIMDFHAGNQLLGSASIDPDCIKIMNELKLGISFDFTAREEGFK